MSSSNSAFGNGSGECPISSVVTPEELGRIWMERDKSGYPAPTSPNTAPSHERETEQIANDGPDNGTDSFLATGFSDSCQGVPLQEVGFFKKLSSYRAGRFAMRVLAVPPAIGASIMAKETLIQVGNEIAAAGARDMTKRIDPTYVMPEITKVLIESTLPHLSQPVLAMSFLAILSWGMFKSTIDDPTPRTNFLKERFDNVEER